MNAVPLAMATKLDFYLKTESQMKRHCCQEEPRKSCERDKRKRTPWAEETPNSGLPWDRFHLVKVYSVVCMCRIHVTVDAVMMQPNWSPGSGNNNTPLCTVRISL